VTLIYGILRFSNFAHGDTMAFGAMVTILFTWGCRPTGITLGRCPRRCWRCPAGIVVTAIFWSSAPTGWSTFYRKRSAAPVIFVIASSG
jgi:branched-chain amino acid transport system permease protein